MMFNFKLLKKTLSSQMGAIFGLDARVALAIFAVLSVVAGASAVLSVQSIRAKSLANEMSAFGTAIEGLHHDLKTDIFSALITPSDQGAFQALYDNIVLEETLMRGRWLGPYVNVNSNTHPHFGERIIAKRGENIKEECSLDNNCFLWLIYSKVTLEATKEANLLLDGRNEENAQTNGRLQWEDALNPRQLSVGYRVSATLNSGEELY